jgi:hypothetical protein
LQEETADEGRIKGEVGESGSGEQIEEGDIMEECPRGEVDEKVLRKISEETEVGAEDEDEEEKVAVAEEETDGTESVAGEEEGREEEEDGVEEDVEADEGACRSF